MTSLFASKKGLHADNIILPIFALFIIMILVIVGSLVGLQILDGYKTYFISDSTIVSVIEKYENVYTYFDKVIFAFAVGLIIAIAYTSYRIAARPVFFVITIIFGIFYCFLAYLVSYMFSQFVSHSLLTGIIAIFPITLMLGTNLHWLGLTMILVGSVALYGKKPNDEPLR